MENKTKKEELLDMFHKLIRVQERHPQLELGVYFLVVCYNFLDIDEIDSAEKSFGYIEPLFFTQRVKEVLDHSMEQVQELVRIKNSMESVIDPRQRALDMVNYSKVKQEAEVFEVISDFFNKAVKSDFISKSPELKEMHNTLAGVEYEIDLDLGKPTLN